MKFDKSKVYTTLNADEVKVGSKGYFADNLNDLRNKVENEDCTLFTISEISSDEHHYRFLASEEPAYSLFYLVDEPEIKEITAEKWNYKPHVMRVWNDCYEDAYNMLVVHIRSADNYHPVVAVSCKEEVCCFKHCAEIAKEK